MSVMESKSQSVLVTGATGNQGGAAKDLKWDQNQPQTRKQQQVQAQAEPPKQMVPNKQQLMLLLRNYKQ